MVCQGCHICDVRGVVYQMDIFFGHNLTFVRNFLNIQGLNNPSNMVFKLPCIHLKNDCLVGKQLWIEKHSLIH